VRYHPTGSANWFGSAHRTIVIDDFVATTPEAHHGLARRLVSVNLVDRIVLLPAPVDSPLRFLLTDERALAPAWVRDETWLRLIDVRAALARALTVAKARWWWRWTTRFSRPTRGRTGSRPVASTESTPRRT
jgi:predicted acetyltransferase